MEKIKITFKAYNGRNEIKSLPVVNWHNATVEDCKKYAAAMCIGLCSWYKSVKVEVYNVETGQLVTSHSCSITTGCRRNGDRPDNQKPAKTPELKIYTMEDWRKDRSFSPAIGQEVTQEVYDDLLNALPPTFRGCGYMQTGEAYSMIRVGDRYVYTYITFNGLEYVGHVPNMQAYGIRGALEMAKNSNTPEFIK